MVALDVKQLRFGAKLGLCWGFLWRGFVTAIGSTRSAFPFCFLGAKRWDPRQWAAFFSGGTAGEWLVASTRVGTAQLVDWWGRNDTRPRAVEG